MSRIVVVNFVTLDGVIQSVLSADEDRDGGFEAGGWVQPYMDEVVARVMSEATTGAGGLLLGRRTYQNFAATWSVADRGEPAVAALNRMPKYVASTTLAATDWENSRILGEDLVAEVTELKKQPGGDIVVFGSGRLIPALAAADLIDRYTLLTFPLVLGTGKRMFADGFAPATLTLLGSEVSTTGVVVLRYGRASSTNTGG
ncbi:dihydrofolate reductase family protein [Actinoplanes sp. NPDC051633]|uniref:dihydrofolate reductase family protein n=1 Tax=Actinoplanes sp. NPDC051633 TaxID=3155670 RepID=UPI003447B9E3